MAVVTVTFNSARLLPDFIASLSDGLAGLAWHLVVVDNASTDQSAHVARELCPAARVVETGRNGGYAAGINVGVTAAPEHDAVLILNPDVRLEPDCGPRLLAALDHPGTGIAVPLLVDRNGDRIDSLRREPAVYRALADAVLGARRAGRIGILGEVVSDGRRYRHECIVDWAEGSTLLVSARCLRECGPWDESYFLYSEETEFALRARSRGFATRFTPAARAVHLEGGSAHTPELWTLVILNRVRLHRRRKGFVPALGMWAVLVLREGSRACLGRQTSRAALRALVSPRRLRERPGPGTVWRGGWRPGLRLRRIS